MSLREFTTAPPRSDISTPNQRANGATTPVFDPLRYCIFTTIALLAWVLGPAIAVVAMSALGIAAYWRAIRAGVTSTRCILGDTRLVMLYLVAAFGAGAYSLGERILSSIR